MQTVVEKIGDISILIVDSGRTGSENENRFWGYETK